MKGAIDFDLVAISNDVSAGSELISNGFVDQLAGRRSEKTTVKHKRFMSFGLFDENVAESSYYQKVRQFGTADKGFASR